MHAEHGWMTGMFFGGWFFWLLIIIVLGVILYLVFRQNKPKSDDTSL